MTGVVTANAQTGYSDSIVTRISYLSSQPYGRGFGFGLGALGAIAKREERLRKHGALAKRHEVQQQSADRIYPRLLTKPYHNFAY
jgi:hypothetical protein